MATRRLLAKKGIRPSFPGSGRRPALWAFDDLQCLKDLIPSPSWKDEAA
jgi:hypothetical protein